MRLLATETIGREDWRLVVATVRGSVADQLPAETREAIFAETWAMCDGYGPDHGMPLRNWDWSGIRDSSKATISAMATAVRSRLELDGVVVVLPETPPCFRQACPECGAAPGDLCKADEFMPLFAAAGAEGHQGYGVHAARPVVCQDCGSADLDPDQDPDAQPFNPYCAPCADAEARSLA